MKMKLDQKIDRTGTIIRTLKRYYPDAHCALVHSNALELLVATILSAQCTDERVNKTTVDLFATYKTAADYETASLTDLEYHLRSINFFRNKAKSLKGMGAKLQADHGGVVPRELEALTQLPGVGRKTANVVLGNAFGIATGIVVDTHVKRLAYRLGLTLAKTPDKVEVDLQKLVATKDWVIVSHLLIYHGRQICKARSPSCEKCFLEGDCPKKGVSR
jgi:endonuclease III